MIPMFEWSFLQLLFLVSYLRFFGFFIFDTRCRWAFHSGLEFLAEGERWWIIHCISFVRLSFKGNIWRSWSVASSIGIRLVLIPSLILVRL